MCPFLCPFLAVSHTSLRQNGWPGVLERERVGAESTRQLASDLDPEYLRHFRGGVKIAVLSCDGVARADIVKAKHTRLLGRRGRDITLRELPLRSRELSVARRSPAGGAGLGGAGPAGRAALRVGGGIAKVPEAPRAEGGPRSRARSVCAPAPAVGASVAAGALGAAFPVSGARLQCGPAG